MHCFFAVNKFCGFFFTPAPSLPPSLSNPGLPKRTQTPSCRCSAPPPSPPPPPPHPRYALASVPPWGVVTPTHPARALLQAPSACCSQEFLDMLGVTDGGLASLIRATYQTLGLQTYFTTGKSPPPPPRPRARASFLPAATAAPPSLLPQRLQLGCGCWLMLLVVAALSSPDAQLPLPCCRCPDDAPSAPPPQVRRRRAPGRSARA